MMDTNLEELNAPRLNGGRGKIMKNFRNYKY